MSSTKIKIYRVPASHPCQAVIRGAELKGIEHKVVDLIPPSQPLLMTLMFGKRTVPAMKIHDGPNGTEKVQTTSKCLRALESIAPDPPFYPAAAAARERVTEAEQWGVGEFQDLVRRVLWVALRNRPSAMISFTKDASLPMPTAMMKPFLRPTIWVERRINDASAKRARADLERLPQFIDQVDHYIESGTIAGETPNAADLAILSSVWLLRSVADIRPMLDSRPAGRRARELFGEAPGEVPSGAIEPAWLTEVNAARAQLASVKD